MKPEEAIGVLRDLWCFQKSERYSDREIREGCEMAIKALKEQMICPIFSDDEVKQPCVKSPCGFKRQHGEWEKVGGIFYHLKCSNCNFELKSPYDKSNFCPNCGASMSEKEGDPE